MNYYNEIDPKAAAWLEALISEGLIPPGHVDQRSICDVTPTDLLRYTQCHFFAGIGGWSLALQLAGWPSDRPVWTGSCPCQPFSTAGKQMGRRDPRHLWPAFRRLINRCRPPVVFGEQVASADGRAWLARVCADLETMGFAPAGVDICAAGIGAPHIRQRLFWAGERLAYADRQECDRHQRDRDEAGVCGSADHGRLADSPERGGHHAGMGNSNMHGREQGQCSATSARYGHTSDPADFWADSIPILCRDGKCRRIPTQPEIFPLADGLPYKLARRGSARSALLKGSGNAIVPQVAALFIRAYSGS